MADPVEEHIVRSVTRSCVGQLGFVRRISSLCFRQDCPTPSAAMTEVESVLGPLDKLFETVQLDERVRRDWSLRVGADVLRSYRDIAVEVLVQGQATQKFITQRSKGENTNNGIAKIVAQFELDLQRLQEIFCEHGVNTPFDECKAEIERFRTEESTD